MNAGYPGSFGRLKVHFTDFLSSDFIKSLMNLDLKDIRLKLYSTSYREDIDKLSFMNDNEINLLISAINRHVINNSKLAIFAVPPEIKDYIKLYISKWDIESIKAIIISKVINHEIKYNDSFILSFRDIPLGIFAGNLSPENFRSLLARNDVESIVNYLLEYGYNYLLKYIDEYKKTGDISPMISAIDYNYYINLVNNIKYFNGDESIIINYNKEIIDVKNILTMIKALELHVPYENIEKYLIENGFRSKNILEDMYRSKNTIQILETFKSYNIDDAIDFYRKNGSLSLFDTSMRKAIVDKYIPLMMRTTGAPFILGYILTAERERDNLRTIIIGRFYNLDDKILEKMLI